MICTKTSVNEVRGFLILSIAILYGHTQKMFQADNLLELSVGNY